MDPVRYGHQQGWDNNNSVIAVSYLNNHLYGLMMMMMIMRDITRTPEIVHLFIGHLILRENQGKLWDSEDMDWICLTRLVYD